MQYNLIYITEGITFQDIIDNKIAKVDVYEKQMNNWYLKPAQLLADNSKNPNSYELEMSLLILLITFFESHGQYLLGESSQHHSSKSVFVKGFNSFTDYLVTQKSHKAEYYNSIEPEKFYSLVRCGLLHNGYIKADGITFFIDKYKIDKTHVVYPNNLIEGNWLINTINMLDQIKDYMSYYINLVRTDKEYQRKFENMFSSFFNLN